jgi:biopolymer transport protein ExbB
MRKPYRIAPDGRLSLRLFFYAATAVAALPVAAAAAEPTTPGERMWIVTVFLQGGLVMWPILICSILALGLAIERGITLRQGKIIGDEFITAIRRLSQRGDFEQAIKLCKGTQTPVARIVKAGLNRAEYGLLEVERAIETTGAHEATLLTNNLRALGALANLTPMLGLLGTVIGMIKAFDVISTSGTGNPGLVASGISEALITTAAGLIIGIPTLALYHYFRGKVDRIVFEMEELSLLLVEDVQSTLEKRGAPKPVDDDEI